MTAISYRFLNVDKFQTLNNWSATQAVSNNDIFSKKYKFLRIGNLLEKSKLPILIQDNTTYKRVTIKLHGNGVKVRDTVLGKEIKTKRLFLLKKGQFVYSRIDARNGAFGLAKDDVDNAVITNDFPAFDVNHKLITPDFLSMITGSKPFFDFCQSLSSGTTGRQRMDENSFLGFEIPLPDLPTQNQLINQYNKNLAKAQKAENQASELEKGIESYLLEELGIEKPKVVERKSGLQFVRLQDLSRWDLWNNSENYTSKIFDNITLQTVILGSPQYGANSKAIKEKSEYRYIRITDLKEDGTLNDDIVSAEKIESQYILENNDFLIARTGATVGKTFLYKPEYGKAIYAGYLIRYKINETKVIPEYLLYFTKSEIYKSWILKSQRVSAQPNINGQEFLKSVLILPPKEIQTQIVNHITIQKEQIRNLRQQAEKLRKQAKENFEKEIFI